MQRVQLALDGHSVSTIYEFAFYPAFRLNNDFLIEAKGRINRDGIPVELDYEPGRNLLVVRAGTDNIERVEKILKSLEKQVMGAVEMYRLAKMVA